MIDSLKEAIIAARKRVLFVEDKVHKLQQALHAPNNQKEIAELKLQIQVRSYMLSQLVWFLLA